MALQFMSESVEAVYRSIVQKIETGALAAGQPLREEIVAATVGVSRTPVREAFRILAAEGWLETRKNHGVRVSHWTLKHVCEIFETRTLIEPYLVQLAVPRITKGDLDRLNRLADTMSRHRCNSVEQITRRQEANDKFHAILIERADQRVLATLLNSVRKVPLIKKTFSAYSDRERDRSDAEHHEIITAIQHADGELAHAIMKAHILKGKHAVLRALRQAPAEASSTLAQNEPAHDSAPAIHS